MKIASLVPSATEILFALGLGDSVVAVTHECDYPAEARERALLTRTVIPAGLGAGEIDAEVRRLTAEGRPLYERGTRLRDRLQGRLDAVVETVSGAPRPRVACLEWLDPPFAAGHWIPEMVWLAGGVETVGVSGSKSVEVEWSEIVERTPERVISMPCGWDVERSLIESEAHRESIMTTGARSIDAVVAAGR